MRFHSAATLRHPFSRPRAVPPSPPALVKEGDPELGITKRLDRLHRQLAGAGIITDLSARVWGDSATAPLVVLAIPATGEEASLGAALRRLAVAFRFARRSCGLVVFANNCADLTGEVVARAADDLPACVVLLEGHLADAHAHAGWARRIAMDAAAELCDPGGAILTTDADSLVAHDWVEACCAALDRGFDLVCGRIAMEEQPDLVARMPTMRLLRAESAYAALQDRVRHCCDQLIGRQPVGGVRPHYVEAGANIGMTRALYRRMGGLPSVPSSEDRALVRAAELCGARIIYTPRSWVETSNRLIGRARGGLAETLSRWLHHADPVADQRLRPVEGIACMWSNALAVAASRPGRMRSVGPAIRHTLLENEWVRSMTEPRMVAADLEREMAGLAAFVREEVEPLFAAWRAAA